MKKPITYGHTTKQYTTIEELLESLSLVDYAYRQLQTGNWLLLINFDDTTPLKFLVKDKFQVFELIAQFYKDPMQLLQGFVK